MKRIIGVSLLGVGVLMVLVGGVWSFQQGLWSLAQDGPAVGLARVFFLVLFLPMIKRSNVRDYWGLTLVTDG